MRQFLEELKDFFKKGDMVLLILCLITSGLGVVIIASATSAEKFGSNFRYIAIQIGATVIAREFLKHCDFDYAHVPVKER